MKSVNKMSEKNIKIQMNCLTRMIKEINSARLIIHTFCGTGHLESLAINKPTLILFVHNLNSFNDKSKNYFKKFIRLGIVHRTPESLIEILENLDNTNN